MKSIKSVYKVGNGPSSSHTVGPYNAAKIFIKRYPDADKYQVTLFGSLALTGEGHSTRKAILNTMPNAEIIFNKQEFNLPHPNTMLFKAFKDGKEISSLRMFSIGGGSIRIEGEESEDEKEIYSEKNFNEIKKYCEKENIDLKEFILRKEGTDILDYIKEIWHVMENSIEKGLSTEGILPGGLNITRKAKLLNEMKVENENKGIMMNRIISSYAYAVAEENASEQIVVTAPTCGSSGVIPSVFYYMKKQKGYSDEKIVDALLVAGLFGNIIRTNASISGAEAGCQAEIGSACSMAAAGLAYLYGLSISQIEYSAETSMEHNLGLTCDPIKGLVQIPCIERNAVAALRAISSVDLSRFLSETRRISFDDIVKTMYQTGLDMNNKYKETSHGGLAALYSETK